MIARDKNSNRIKWRVTDQLENDEKLALGRYKLWFILSNQSLQDRAGAMFCGLARKIKLGLFSSQRDIDIYQEYLADIRVVKKHRQRNVDCVNENDQLCNMVKWYEKILNIKGDFCYVSAGTRWSFTWIGGADFADGASRSCCRTSVAGKYVDLSNLLAANLQLQQKDSEPKLLLNRHLVLTSHWKDSVVRLRTLRLGWRRSPSSSWLW